MIHMTKMYAQRYVKRENQELKIHGKIKRHEEKRKYVKTCRQQYAYRYSYFFPLLYYLEKKLVLSVYKW